MVRWKHFLAAGVIGLALCGGCAKTFTRQQYETIYKGQPAWAVEKKLGRPHGRTDGQWTYVHRHPYYKAVIEFRDGHVSRKVWHDWEQPATAPARRDAPATKKADIEKKRSR